MPESRSADQHLQRPSKTFRSLSVEPLGLPEQRGGRTPNARLSSAASSSVLTYDQLAAVSEVTQTPSRHGKALRFKLHDKLRALELLGQHLGIFEISDRSDKSLMLKMYEAMTEGVAPYEGERPEKLKN